LKVNLEGCAICGSTWGNYWAEVDGEKMFFCCEICFVQFKNMVNEVKKRTAWNKIDSIDIEGDYRGRECAASLGKDSYRYFVSFDARGEIAKFRESQQK
jgi:Ta0938